MTPLLRKFLSANWVLLANVLALLVWGIYAIYNASAFREDMVLANKWRDQVQWAAGGMVIMFAVALVDYKWIRWGGLILYVLGLIGLIAVKVIGTEVNGAQSWIRIGGFSFQPSQIAIVAGISILAFILGDLHRFLPWLRYHWLRLLLACGMAGVPMLMVLTEPDLGSAMVWGPVLVAMLLVANIPFRYLIVMFLVMMCVIPLAYFFKLKPYQKARIQTFINMATNKPVDKLGDAYMQDKLQIAVGSGGFEGKGPLSEKVQGHSVHRMFFSESEAINDFIYAVIVEEFGFRGGVMQIAVMALLLMQCIFVAFYARDQLGRLIVVGVVGMMFAHSMQNMGMNILMMPVTGLPMPFVSYGGTFLVMCLFLMGLVQSVWIHRNISPVQKRSNQDDGYMDE